MAVLALLLTAEEALGWANYLTPEVYAPLDGEKLAKAASGKADYLAASGIVLAVWALVAILWFTAFYDGGRPVYAFLLLLLGPVYAGFLLGHGLAIYDIADCPGRCRRHPGPELAALHPGRHRGQRHRGLRRREAHWPTPHGAGASAPARPGRAPPGGSSHPSRPCWRWAGLLGVGVELWEYAIAAVVVAIAAQAGDLAESALKRAANTKDSGSIMPGHGGLLDRIDSILFALPAVYYLLALGFGL